MTLPITWSFVLSIAFISPLAVLPAAVIATTSPAWADSSMTSGDSSDDSSSDASQEEDVRSAAEETCNEVTSSELQVSRC